MLDRILNLTLEPGFWAGFLAAVLLLGVGFTLFLALGDFIEGRILPATSRRPRLTGRQMQAAKRGNGWDRAGMGRRLPR